MRIAICGDFATKNRGQQFVNNKVALSDNTIKELKKSDFRIVNLESPVVGEDCTPINKMGPHLHTEESTVKYLKECGFDMVTLANNHFCDYGYKSVEKTIKSLEKELILYVGGGRVKEEIGRILYLNSSDNTKIAILNYCEYEFSIQEGYGSNHLDLINVCNDILQAKNCADFVIIIVHGGHEGYNLPSPRMQRTYRFFIERGADVVINNHQHCYSGYENYRDKLIVYGLGNFYFDRGEKGNRNAKNNDWNEGYWLELNIGKGKLIDFRIIPYIQCLEKAQTELMDGDRKNRFLKKINELNKIIESPDEIEKRFVSYCCKNNRNFLAWFSIYTNRLLLAAVRRGVLPSFLCKKKKTQLLNLIRCEAHRDISMNILNF